MQQIRDVDIRRRLDAVVHRLHRDEADTLILHELVLCQGAARVDLAVVNGSLHGYEIKSEADTLERLPGQRAIYCRTLDFVTIVTSDRHARKVKQRVPRWWGIWAAVASDSGLTLNEVRHASQNPRVDARAVVTLLWREEALAELELLELADGFRSKPRGVLWQRLANALPLDELGGSVRQRLKQRGPRWRPTLARPT